MPEQFANLDNVSLAVAYVAGFGSITVTSAAGLPASGTFSVTLVNGGNNQVLMIFRVTGVAGAGLLTGAAEGLDVNCPAGTLVYGTMLTAAAMTQVRADVVGSVLIPPVLTALTQNNVDKSVVSSNADGSGFTMVVTGQNNAEHLQCVGVTVGGAFGGPPYNFDIAFRSVAVSGGGGANGGPGVGFIESLGDTTHHYGLMVTDYMSANVCGAGVALYDSVTAHDSSPKSGQLISNGTLLWLRVHDDGVTHRDYWFSPDGVTWQMFYQEGRTTLFTPTAVGVFFNPFSAGGVVSVIHWNLHKA